MSLSALTVSKFPLCLPWASVHLSRDSQLFHPSSLWSRTAWSSRVADPHDHLCRDSCSGVCETLKGERNRDSINFSGFRRMVHCRSVWSLEIQRFLYQLLSCIDCQLRFRPEICAQQWDEEKLVRTWRSINGNIYLSNHTSICLFMILSLPWA